MKKKQFQKLVLGQLAELRMNDQARQETLDLVLGQTLSIKQTCKVLGVSENTLRKMRETGQIGFLDGTKIEFTRLQILEYQRNREVRAKGDGLIPV